MGIADLLPSIVRPGAPDAFHSTPGMTNYVDPMGPMTQGPDIAPVPAVPAGPAPLPYDAQYEATKNQINAGLAGLKSSSDLSTQRTNEDYTTNVGTAGKNQTQNLSNLQNKLANQGIGYSGINVSEQGRLGEQYQTQLGNLAQNKQRSLEDIQRNLVAKQGDYQNQLSQAEIARSGRADEAAKAQAADEAQALAAKTTADLNRQWMSDLSNRITGMVQPAATPTGQMALPPTNPQHIVQQAIAAVPPPAAKTPQQQAAEAGIDPKQLQTLLTQRGFSTGPVDGIMGIKTQQALARWKQSVGLPATADITPEIWQQLLSSGVGNVSGGSNIAMASSGPARRDF